MALHIENPIAAELAGRLAERTGESVDEATIRALEERLNRTQNSAQPAITRANRDGLAYHLRELGRQCASLPTLDTRSEDEILGYNENGLFA